jgi:hypothetical protein
MRPIALVAALALGCLLTSLPTDVLTPIIAMATGG